jgi:hypothetical protein
MSDYLRGECIVCNWDFFIRDLSGFDCGIGEGGNPGDCSDDTNAQPDCSGAFALEGTVRPLERMSMHLASVFRTNTDLIR